MTLRWHKMKSGYYVAAGKRFIFELSQDSHGWWALLRRAYFDGDGLHDVDYVSYHQRFQSLQDAKNEAALHELLLDDKAPAN